MHHLLPCESHPNISIMHEVKSGGYKTIIKRLWDLRHSAVFERLIVFILESLTYHHNYQIPFALNVGQ